MEEDNLSVDPEISNQKYVCLSILTSNSIKDEHANVIKTDNTARGIKIRGVYSTIEEATKRCEQIRKFDPNFNVFIGEVGKWLPWEDDIDKAEDAVYAEEKLNSLMKGYKDSQAKAKEYQELRKQQDINNSIKKAKELTADEENIIESDVINEEKEVKSKKEELSTIRKDIESKDKKVNTINVELEKARKLFEELTKQVNEK